MPTEIAVAPALGHGLLATQGGIGATPGYDAIDLRRMIEGLHGKRPGVLDVGGWKVTERAVAPAMAVDVAANVGLARVNGGSVAAQGGYVIAPHATLITLDVPASNATDPRIDSVFLTVRDGAHDGSGFTDARVVLLAGTATAGASLDNRNGAPGAPTSSVHLADIGVGPNVSSVANGQIRSYRPLIVSGREVGDTFFWPVNAIPAGCVQASGDTLQRLVYRELFDLIGTAFGVGDGVLTFTRPSLTQGRALIGQGTAQPFAALGGAQTHTLTEGQSAAHSHGNHNHGYTRVTSGTVRVASGTALIVPATGVESVTTDNAGIAASGGGQAHNNMPPYLALTPCIFAGVA